MSSSEWNPSSSPSGARDGDFTTLLNNFLTMKKITISLIFLGVLVIGMVLANSKENIGIQ